MGGVIKVDEVLATLMVLTVNDVVQACSGYVHGRGITGDLPVCMLEAALLHSLQLMKEWMGGVYLMLTQHITLKAGDALACHRVSQ